MRSGWKVRLALALSIALPLTAADTAPRNSGRCPAVVSIESIARFLGYADALGVQHIVFGHQAGTYELNEGSKRTKGTMFRNFGGLVFLIDMGMSRGVDYSKGASLRITNDGVIALFPDGKTEPWWPRVPPR